MWYTFRYLFTFYHCTDTSTVWSTHVNKILSTSTALNTVRQSTLKLKITPGGDDHQENKLTRDRLAELNELLLSFCSRHIETKTTKKESNASKKDHNDGSNDLLGPDPNNPYQESEQQKILTHVFTIGPFVVVLLIIFKRCYELYCFCSDSN